MSIDTWWIVLGAWTITGLLFAIAFGRVARSNEEQEQDSVLDLAMSGSSTPNVRHFRRQKRTAVAAAETHQALSDVAKRRVK